MKAQRAHLRTRVTLFFFLVAAAAALVSAGAVLLLDRVIAQEIAHRTKKITHEVQRIIQDERERVQHAIEGLVQRPEIQSLLLRIDNENALASDEVEALASQRAAAEQLDLLAFVAARGPFADKIISSAHLPRAVEKPGPSYLSGLEQGETIVGFVHERVEGNPPPIIPAIVAARLITRGDQPALYLYGGLVLDSRRLSNIARMGNVTLILESPGLRLFTSARLESRKKKKGSTIPLDVLPNGRALTDSPTTEKGPTRIMVHVNTDRLRAARASFLNLAIATGAGAFLFALLLGTGLSRRITKPILELSAAAKKVGAGDLEVELEPTSNDEVGALVEVFNQMTRELRDSRTRLQRAERIAAWREIARRVAHEIKNPLFPIQMSMETLRKSFKRQHPKLDEIVEESTQTVLEEVRALNRIVSEFSDFARLPAPQKRTVQPLEILDHLVGLYASEDRSARVQCDRDAIASRDLPNIEADREQIGRALINLVKNALEALPDEGGSVTIDASLAARGALSGVQLIVSDDGPGMPEEIRAKIFTPYYTTKQQGTGLGLAIVERIVAEHDGSIDLETAPDEGTTFRLWLPSKLNR